MYKSLFEEFKRLKGQPVKVYTDDGRSIVGRVLNVFEDAVRLIDDCGRIILVEFRHIDAVVEPQMELERCCRRDNCDCCERRDNCGERRDGCDY